jgi:FkbM family methyltransferase
MVALHLGHKVISFEPFKSNVEMLCASLTELPEELKFSHFRLFNLGLDIRARTCELFQQKTRNIGDTHSVCDSESKQQFIQKGYAPLGWMNTTTLDEALENGLFDFADHIDVMKVDVEGFEHLVIDGGNRFFQSKLAPRYVYMELVSSLMGDAGGLKDRGAQRLEGVLMRLANYGYELDNSFRPSDIFLQTSPLEAVRDAVDGKTVMFVHHSAAL